MSSYLTVRDRGVLCGRDFISSRILKNLLLRCWMHIICPPVRWSAFLGRIALRSAAFEPRILAAAYDVLTDEVAEIVRWLDGIFA